MGLSAGKRDRRITIERYTGEDRDSFNNPVKNWAPLATVWAEKNDVSDGERVAAQEAGAEITTRFRILWSPDVASVDPKCRIVLDGRVYDVTGVKEIGTRVGLEITTVARAENA